MKNNILEVDIKGLRQLQEEKPKWVIIRELLQNAMDEEITQCNIYMNYEYGKAHITVEDDSPTGFRDLADAYTLFKDTYKRSNPKKRGRFNFAEKQIICLSDYTRIISTIGALEFDVLKGERTTLRRKREKGSEIYVVARMTKEEYEECKQYVNSILPPENISITVNLNSKSGLSEIELSYKNPHKVFSAKLLTVLKEDDKMRNVTRETDVHVHLKEGNSYVYEMGIPICEIDCEYSIDVQQKVPLSSDRDKVDGKYLKDIFALVLNNVVDEVKEDDISQTWIRAAMDSDRIESDTVHEVKEKRFGDKALIFNPFDEQANDEAISKGYRLIHGSEMSSNEWDKMKMHAGLVSTTSLFGKTAKDCKRLKWEKHHYPVARLAIKIAKDYGNYDLSVTFIRERSINAAATYGGNELTFNLAKLSKDFFLPVDDGYVKLSTLDLIIHELGHRGGHHTEHSYHDYITRLGAWLALKSAHKKGYLRIGKKTKSYGGSQS